MKNRFIAFILVCTVGYTLTSCQKNDYYYDSGKHKAEYNGTVLDYLKQNPNHLFDSLSRVVKLAGMENIFQSDSITFFAPADTTIKKSISVLNNVLISRGRDTITNMAQINPALWRQELSMYLYRGKHRLKDYSQIDRNNLPVYGGQYYTSYDGRVMNIGVVYNDAGNVKYAGYRQLMLTYFPNFASPTVGRYYNLIASSDIAPTNGIVHVLVYEDKYFGFDPYHFADEVIASGIDYTKQ